MNGRNRAFWLIDVFTSRAGMGSPLAVIPDADGLSDNEMLRLAAWLKFPETSFVLRTGIDESADYRIRIFAPHGELKFAGHPTIGTAHGMLVSQYLSKQKGMLRQQCAAGLVDVHVPENWWQAGVMLTAPRPEITDLTSGEVCAALKTDTPYTADRIDVGAIWIVLQLATAAAVRTLAPDMELIRALSNATAATGVTVFAEAGDGTLVTRTFAPAVGISEDPACGSGNAAVAYYLMRRGSGDRSCTASQGRELGHDSEIRVEISGGKVRIGGNSVLVASGTMTIWQHAATRGP